MKAVHRNDAPLLLLRGGAYSLGAAPKRAFASHYLDDRRELVRMKIHTNIATITATKAIAK
jgi:hypothetical protein